MVFNKLTTIQFLGLKSVHPHTNLQPDRALYIFSFNFISTFKTINKNIIYFINNLFIMIFYNYI